MSTNEMTTEECPVSFQSALHWTLIVKAKTYKFHYKLLYNWLISLSISGIPIGQRFVISLAIIENSKLENSSVQAINKTNSSQRHAAYIMCKIIFFFILYFDECLVNCQCSFPPILCPTVLVDEISQFAFDGEQTLLQSHCCRVREWP